MNEEKILRNLARCNKCLEELESKHTHDFRRCSCGGLAVDGGRSYIRRCFRTTEPGDGYTEMSEYDTTTE